MRIKRYFGEYMRETNRCYFHQNWFERARIDFNGNVLNNRTWLAGRRKDRKQMRLTYFNMQNGRGAVCETSTEET